MHESQTFTQKNLFTIQFISECLILHVLYLVSQTFRKHCVCLCGSEKKKTDRREIAEDSFCTDAASWFRLFKSGTLKIKFERDQRKRSDCAKILKRWENRKRNWYQMLLFWVLATFWDVKLLNHRLTDVHSSQSPHSIQCPSWFFSSIHPQ